jgi:hypothetical protein
VSEHYAISKNAVRRTALAIAGAVLVVVLALVAVALSRLLVSQDPLAAGVNPAEYQAVFLSNGQVYFGKLTVPGGDFYYLRHVYYLQSQTSPQNPGTQRLLPQKLTNAIHSPEDLLIINRSQVLFVENLKRSGRLSQLIQQGGT